MDGPFNCAVVGADVFQAAFRRYVNRFAGAIFGVRLDSDGPVGDVDEDAGDRNGVRAGVDDAGDVLAVPVHDDRDLGGLSRSGAPVAGPGSGEGVALLCKSRRNETEIREKTSEVNLHRISKYISRGEIQHGGRGAGLGLYRNFGFLWFAQPPLGLDAAQFGHGPLEDAMGGGSARSTACWVAPVRGSGWSSSIGDMPDSMTEQRRRRQAAWMTTQYIGIAGIRLDRFTVLRFIGDARFSGGGDGTWRGLRVGAIGDDLSFR